jgi:hypothetical protein
MFGPLDAVIDDLASERRELVALNPPDDGALDDVLDYFERVDVSDLSRVTDAALPAAALLVTDGDRCLASADLERLHTYLFEFDPAAEETAASGDGESHDGPTDEQLSAAEVDGIQRFLSRLDNRVYTVTGETVTPMVGVSRHIEQRALAAGGGTIHAGFQQLSRLRDKRQTLETYSTLAERGLDVNLYGTLDWEPPSADSVTVHGDETGDIVGDYWFVVVDSEESGGGALVAREDEPRVYTGFWTFRPPLVGDVASVVETDIQPELRRLD